MTNPQYQRPKRSKQSTPAVKTPEQMTYQDHLNKLKECEELSGNETAGFRKVPYSFINNN